MPHSALQAAADPERRTQDAHDAHALALQAMREVTELAGTHSGEIARGISSLMRVAQQKEDGFELVLVILQDSTEALQNKREPRGRGLSEEQAKYLIDSGAFDAEELAETEKAVQAGELAEEERKTRLGALSRTISAVQVASLLNLSESRVRHRQAKGLLYGILVGNKRRYPTWQFDKEENAPLPHLATIVKALPKDWNPAAVEAFMTNPKSSLRVTDLVEEDDALVAKDDVEFSPVEWLESGGDPKAVISLLTSFLQS